MRILIVEDEKDINQLVKMHLEKAGYLVDQAFDGADAIRFLRWVCEILEQPLKFLI